MASQTARQQPTAQPTGVEKEPHGLGAATSAAISVPTGTVLGSLAVVADVADGPLGRILQVLASTGLSWAAAVVLLGAYTQRRSYAAVSGLLLLTAATTSYYCLIVTAGVRPSVDIGDLVRSAVLWLLVGAAAGPIAGVGGHLTRYGAAKTRAIAWGAMCGLLASQGLTQLVDAIRWAVTPTPTSLGIPLLLVVVPAAALIHATRGRRLLIALTAAITVSATAAAGWYILQTILRGGQP